MSRPSMVQIMLCCLFSAKPLSEPMLDYFVKWFLGNKFLLNLNENKTIFIQEIKFENDVCEMVAILLAQLWSLMTPVKYEYDILTGSILIVVKSIFGSLIQQTLWTWSKRSCITWYSRQCNDGYDFECAWDTPYLKPLSQFWGFGRKLTML